MRALVSRHARDERKQAGFTLIELLVVIVIIAILAAIAIPTYLGARVHAQNSAAFTLVRNALTAIESARINLGGYDAITASELEDTEPTIHWNIVNVDLVDPTIPTVTTNVTARARSHAVDFYAQSDDTFDVATISESGDRYGIEVQTNTGAQTEYVKVKLVDGQGSVGW
jgi:prepilin-type N-terminal cleavage/methylation domain-containing protein